MAKLVLNDVASLANTLTAKTLLNDNFAELERAFDDTLSRSGATPNHMGADIDLNSFDLLNVGRLDANEIYRNGLPIEMEVAYANKRYQIFDGNGAQVDFPLSLNPGSLGNLEISISGVVQRPGIDFSFSDTTLTFVVAPPLGSQNILVRYDQAVPTGITDSGSITYQQLGTGAFSYPIEEKARERVSVLDYIPPALRTSVRTGAIAIDLINYLEAAVDACASFTKAELIWPAGSYPVSRALQVHQVGLVMTFEGGAELITTSATENILEIGDGSTNPAHMFIHGGYFKSTVAKSDGAAIYIRNGHNVTIRDVTIAENTHDGIVFEGGAGQFGYYLERFLITQHSGDGLRFQNVSPGVGLLQDVHVQGGVISTNTPTGTYGMRFLAGSGTYVRGVDILGCQYSVFTQPATGDGVNYSFFDQVIADTPFDTAWSLNDIGGTVFVWQVNNSWGNTAENDGFFLGGSAPDKIRNIKIQGSVFSNNGANGIQLFRTANVIIKDNNCSGNNINNTANKAGIKVLAGCSTFNLGGNICDNNYFAGVPGNQHFGIEVAGGASNNYIITENMLFNNLTVNMTDGGTGTNKYVDGNVGYTPPRLVPTLSGTWANAGGAFAAAGYQKTRDVVRLSGTVTGGTGVIMTLPAGYRPTAQRVYAVVGNSLFARVDVKPSGDVELVSGTTPISLDSITFELG